MQSKNEYMFRDVNIELTNVCNFNCLFCPNDIMSRDKGFMDFATAKTIINDLAENKITRLINFYLMGESLLHSEIFNIFDYAFSKGFSIKLNTNASTINEEVALKLLNYPDLNIFISYHTPYRESYDLYRRSKGIDFKQWKNNIENLIKLKYKHHSSTPITLLLLKTPVNFSNEIRGNINLISNNIEANKIIDGWKVFAQNLMEQPISIKQPVEVKENPWYSSVKKILSYLNRLNYSETILPGFNITVIKIHSWSNSAKDQVGKRFRSAIFGSCEALRDTISVLWNGDYTLCCADFDGELVQGNVRETKISQFLIGDQAKKIINSFKRNRLPFQKCRECRGASNFYNWLFNQIHTAIFYNSPAYRKIRNRLFIDTK